VVEHLGLEGREQSRVVAAKGFYSLDNIKLVARVITHYLGPSFVPKFKYALDFMNGTVYALVLGVGGDALMAGRSFEVDGQTLSFYHVLSIEVRSENDDRFQSVQSLRLWPYGQ